MFLEGMMEVGKSAECRERGMRIEGGRVCFLIFGGWKHGGVVGWDEGSVE